MHKQEALDLLKEIIARQAANWNWLSFRQLEPGKYEVTIKGDFNKEMIYLIVKEKSLTVNESNGSLSIY